MDLFFEQSMIQKVTEEYPGFPEFSRKYSAHICYSADGMKVYMNVKVILLDKFND